MSLGVSTRSTEAIGVVGNTTLSGKQNTDDAGEEGRRSPGQYSWVGKRDGV